MYLVSSYNNGSLNIGDIRFFEKLEDAWSHADSLIPDYLRPNPSSFLTQERVDSLCIRVYLVSATESPKLQKRKSNIDVT